MAIMAAIFPYAATTGVVTVRVAPRYLPDQSDDGRALLDHLVVLEQDREAGRPRSEIREAIAHGRADDERWHVKKDGSRFWANAITMALRDAQHFVRHTDGQGLARGVVHHGVDPIFTPGVAHWHDLPNEYILVERAQADLNDIGLSLVVKG